MGLDVSLVMLVYNQRDLVEEAVRAALAQDCPPIEIVISDDCSADGSFAAIERAVAGYGGPHDVRLNRNPANLGLIGHINLTGAGGLARGDMIVYAAGDDISHPQRVRRIMGACAREAPLLVHSDARVVDMEGHEQPKFYRAATFFKSTDPLVAAESISLCLGASSAWHADLFRKYGPIGEGCYEDLVLGFRAALEGRIAFVGEDLLTYRVGGGITTTPIDERDADAFRARRLKHLALMEAVYGQRLRDGATFGLGRRHPVMRRLRRALTRATLGRAYLEGGPGRLLAEGRAHPATALRTLRSERRRLARAARAAGRGGG